jgi:hypothetical protein
MNCLAIAHLVIVNTSTFRANDLCLLHPFEFILGMGITFVPTVQAMVRGRVV